MAARRRSIEFLPDWECKGESQPNLFVPLTRLDGCLWHISNLKASSGDVRFWGQSSRLALGAVKAAVDPKRK